jgi:hypothetical protein
MLKSLSCLLGDTTLSITTFNITTLSMIVKLGYYTFLLLILSGNMTSAVMLSVIRQNVIRKSVITSSVIF